MLHRMILWNNGRPTPLFRAQWNRLGAAQPLRDVVCLEPDRSASRHFRGLWEKAFPARDPLPYGPLSTEDGYGTNALLDRLA